MLKEMYVRDNEQQLQTEAKFMVQCCTEQNISSLRCVLNTYMYIMTSTK